MSSGSKVALIADNAAQLTLPPMASLYIHDVDLLLAEGCSRAAGPKILVLGSDSIEAAKPLPFSTIVALVAEKKIDAPIPIFTFNEIAQLATLIENQFLCADKPGPSA